MNQFKKMARTAVSVAVLATLGAAANAGTVTVTATNIAQEAWGPARDATTVVTTPAIGYQFSTPGGIVINPGGTIHVTVTPTNGKLASVGAVTLPTGTGGNLAGVATVNTTTGVLDIALSNAATSASNAVIGVGGVVSVAAGTAIGVNGLATGTSMTAVGSVGVGVGGAELEATSATAGTIFTSSQAVLVAAAAAAETAKIDVTTTTTANIGKVLTGGLAGGTTIETLGTVTFTNSTTVAKEIDGTTTFNLAYTTPYPAANTPVTYTLGLASGAFSAGVVYSLATGSCGGTVASVPVTSTQAPAAILASTTSVTLSSLAVPATGVPIFVCGTFPGTAAITPYKPTVAAVLTRASTSYVGETLAATNMYDLGYNGASVTVRNYIPSGVTGYVQTVRLINTGSSSATAFVSLIDDVTGVATTPVTVGSAMAPGAAQRLSQATIEAALATAGVTVSSTSRPRLRFTAATATMEAQSFFNNANGAYTNLVGQDTN